MGKALIRVTGYRAEDSQAFEWLGRDLPAALSLAHVRAAVGYAVHIDSPIRLVKGN